MVGFVAPLGSPGGASDQRPIPVPGRADRDRRSAPRRAEHARDRRAARSLALDDLARAAAQRAGRPRISAFRCAPARYRAPSTSPSDAGSTPTPELGAAGRRAAGSTVEPAADQPPPALRFPDDPVDVAVARKYLSGCLSTEFAVPVGPHGWRRIAAHRCAPVEITAAPISASGAGGRGSSSRCSPSMSGPFPPIDRSQAGHWEGDLIIGNDHRSAIGTLVERQTRMLRLLHLPRADSDALHAALVARMQRPAAGADAVDHLGPGHRDGAAISLTADSSGRRSTSATPDHPGNAAATRTPTACCATTSPRASTSPPLAGAPAGRRERTQPPAPNGPPRPLPRRPIRRPASLKQSVGVATLTRTHPVVTGLGLGRRQQAFAVLSCAAGVGRTHRERRPDWGDRLPPPTLGVGPIVRAQTRQRTSPFDELSERVLATSRHVTESRG